MTTEKLSLGSFIIHALRDGFFSLDGGAMFGVVPKVLWERLIPSDKQNRIKMGLNSVLVQTEEDVVLIETGIGTLLKKKYYEFYSVERDPGLISELAALGIKPEDIDYVINTHLHFDHCGNNTFRADSGEIMPTFPNARYVIQKGEWETALNPSLRDRPSYLSDLFLPLEKAGVLQLVEGDIRVIDGIEVLHAPGHTAHHQCVKISSHGENILFLGDMVPTSAHVNLPYVMSYDLYPVQTIKTREKIYKNIIEGDWLVAFNHDPEHFFGRIEKSDEKYIFNALKT
jgi:glyoxylase-like metal-dependent hydrolase (beta-lactamase superfamily II)